MQIKRKIWVGYAEIRDILYPSMEVAPLEMVPLDILMEPYGYMGGYLYRLEVSGPSSYSQTYYSTNPTLAFPSPGLYDVRVYTQNDCGWTPYYYPLSFFCTTLFAVYPNPADQSFTVTPDSGLEKGKISFKAALYDHLGQAVRQADSSAGKVTFNTDDLPGGTYYLHVEHNGKVEKHQVVISH